MSGLFGGHHESKPKPQPIPVAKPVTQANGAAAIAGNTGTNMTSPMLSNQQAIQRGSFLSS
jgi:hypothetical protein